MGVTVQINRAGGSAGSASGVFSRAVRSTPGTSESVPESPFSLFSLLAALAAVSSRCLALFLFPRTMAVVSAAVNSGLFFAHLPSGDRFCDLRRLLSTLFVALSDMCLSAVRHRV